MVRVSLVVSTSSSSTAIENLCLFDMVRSSVHQIICNGTDYKTSIVASEVIYSSMYGSRGWKSNRKHALFKEMNIFRAPVNFNLPYLIRYVEHSNKTSVKCVCFPASDIF
jgi:hypothetical protein